MRYRLFSILVLFISSAFSLTNNLYGQAEVFINKLEGEQVSVGATLIVTDDKEERSVYDSTEYLNNRLILNLFSEEGDTLAVGTYKVLVDLAYWDPKSDHERSAPSGQLHELIIDINGTSAGRGMTSISFEGANRIEATIRAITLDNQPIPEDKKPNIQLVGEIAAKSINCDPNSFAVSNDVVFVSGSNGQPAIIEIPNLINNACWDEFDFEWTFLDEDDRILEAFNADPTNPDVDPSVDDLFRQDATRVTSPTPKVRFNGLYRDGLVIARYRIVHYDQYGLRRYTNWSSAGKLLSEYLMSTAAVGHETDMNWQATNNFAEEAKQLPTISYLDGTLRPRLNLTRGYYNARPNENAADEYSMAQQVIYDGMGRPAITTIPAPLLQNIPSETGMNGNSQTLDFSSDYLAINSDLGASDVIYGPDQVELGSCNSMAPSMSTESGAGLFFSAANTDMSRNAYVPDAEGYPFSVTRYTADNTGRIQRQGGVGLTLQTGNGHETRYYYGKPTQWELDRLFGVNVGYASHYEKHLVVDPNGQASVSYLDAKGRVIATALAGDAPANLSELSTFVGEDAPLVVEDILDNVDTDDELVTTHTMLVAAPTNQIDLCYVLKQAQICDDCLTPCQDCVYDVEIKISAAEACNWNGGESIVATFNDVTSLSASGLCFDDADETNIIAGVEFPVGEYRITKRIRINEGRYQENL
ncbi:MAG: hypothetical protein AAFY91_00665, partial [Bacteroidota bacterium]